LKKFYLLAVLLGISILAMLGVQNAAYADMAPANPDSTTKWETDSNETNFSARSLLRSSVDEPVIADISKWQGTIDWKTASNYLDLVIIRTQAGSSYEDPLHKVNENAAIQYKVPFGVYAYNKSISSADAKAEAKDFYNRANKNTLFYVVDVEENTSKSGESMRTIINSYVTELRKYTDKKIGVYIAHHLYKSLNIDTSKFDFVWIPRYNNTNTPPNYDYDLWQYTDKGIVKGINTYVDLNRLHPDVTLEFFTDDSNDSVDAGDPSDTGGTTDLGDKTNPGEKTDAGDKTSPGDKTNSGEKNDTSDPNYAGELLDLAKYYTANPKKVVILKTIYQYANPNLTQDAKKTALTANSIVSVTGVAFSSKGTPCLRLSNGYYISAAKDYVLKVTADIGKYYTTAPKKVVVKKGLYEYRSMLNITANRIRALQKNTVVPITGIVYSATGTPKLKTSRGTYITAHKDYVLKMTANIDHYYTTVPKKVKITKGLYEYKSTNCTTANRIRAVKKNTVVPITGIVYTASGTPILKTSKGTYISANKSYVQKLA
jgi:GH25 family lysozyme M1 (1,4-beta-N-acetylmuramidase)